MCHLSSTRKGHLSNTQSEHRQRGHFSSSSQKDHRRQQLTKGPRHSTQMDHIRSTKRDYFSSTRRDYVSSTHKGITSVELKGVTSVAHTGVTSVAHSLAGKGLNLERDVDMKHAHEQDEVRRIEAERGKLKRCTRLRSHTATLTSTVP